MERTSGISWAFWGGLLLIILKLCGIVTMSWWLVLMPWYGPAVLLVLFVLITGWSPR